MKMPQFSAQYHFANSLKGTNGIQQQKYVSLKEVDPDKYSPNDLQDDVVVFSHATNDLTLLTNMDYLKHASNFALLMTACKQLAEKQLISQETLNHLEQQIIQLFIPQPPPERRR